MIKETDKKQYNKNDINQWINEFQPTHFLSLQLPETMKKADFERSKSHLQRILASFEYRLIGRSWHKKHLFFIAISEHGHSEKWHYHILFNQGKYQESDIQLALLKTASALHLPLYSLYLKRIETKADYVTTYTTKEIKIRDYKQFDSQRIIPSTVLFDLPYKAI